MGISAVSWSTDTEGRGACGGASRISGESRSARICAADSPVEGPGSRRGDGVSTGRRISAWSQRGCVISVNVFPHTRDKERRPAIAEGAERDDKEDAADILRRGRTGGERVELLRQEHPHVADLLLGDAVREALVDPPAEVDVRGSQPTVCATRNGGMTSSSFRAPRRREGGARRAGVAGQVAWCRVAREVDGEGEAAGVEPRRLQRHGGALGEPQQRDAGRRARWRPASGGDGMRPPSSAGLAAVETLDGVPGVARGGQGGASGARTAATTNPPEGTARG